MDVGVVEQVVAGAGYGKERHQGEASVVCFLKWVEYINSTTLFKALTATKDFMADQNDFSILQCVMYMYKLDGLGSQIAHKLSSGPDSEFRPCFNAWLSPMGSNTVGL